MQVQLLSIGFSLAQPQPLQYNRISAERFGGWSWGEVSLTVTPLWGTHTPCSQDSLGSSLHVSV